MTGAQVIVLAMPVFLLAIAAEFAIGLARGRNTYRLNDTLGSLGLGVMSQVFDAFGTLFKVAIYTWAFQHVALFELSSTSPWVWIGALLGYDLCYYGLHRERLDYRIEGKAKKGEIMITWEKKRVVLPFEVSQ